MRSSPDGAPKMSELAEWLTLSRGGITKLVDRLQEAGYLERVSCSSDRRSLHAQLTPAGERMLEEMRVVYEAEIERHLAALTAEEAETDHGLSAEGHRQHLREGERRARGTGRRGAHRGQEQP